MLHMHFMMIHKNQSAAADMPDSIYLKNHVMSFTKGPAVSPTLFRL
jgi:hypothetical protein